MIYCCRNTWNRWIDYKESQRRNSHANETWHNRDATKI